jgi:hypothetical protein
LVIQYPDTISFSDGGTPAVYDENTGRWTPGTPGSTVESECRYEASGGNGWISTEDGQRINYAGIVYLPKGAPRLKTGTKVTVTVKREGESDLVINDEVLRFHPGQMNARVWL